MRLLRDNEAEVRIAAAGKVTKFCRILSPELAIEHILPCVKVPAYHDCLTEIYIIFSLLLSLRKSLYIMIALGIIHLTNI